jgi:phosphoribosylformylglycinamidine cyclo-ligase
MSGSTKQPGAPATGLSYAQAGVSIEAGDQFVQCIQSSLRKTHGPRVIHSATGFAGLFRLDFNEKLFQRNYREPVLVACADGVGTKIKLAIELDKYDTIGIDLVAMNVNDLIVAGAEPLFFLDYIATGALDPAKLADIVKGISDGCVQTSCALLGGETAEMPDVYAPGEIDLAGFSVGVVELKRATDPERVEAGDIVLGLASSGIHSNGYSLVRKIIETASLDLNQRYEELGDARTLGEIILEPTRLYADAIVSVQRSYRVKKIITAMAHITGGGFAGNLSRALHPGVDALIDADSWPVPPIFQFLQRHGGVSDEEMARVFNMGIGYCCIVRPTFAQSVAQKLSKSGQQVYTLGSIEAGSGKVRFTTDSR